MPRSRPTSEDQRAARANRTERARKGTGDALIVTLRMSELYRVLVHRGGPPLPDDDGGRDDLRLLFQTLSTSRNAAARMGNVRRTWAPWMLEDEMDALIADVSANPRRFKADTVGARLGMTAETRTHLGLRTIGAIDETAEERKVKRRERQRLAAEQKRRAAGVPTRADIHARRLNAPRPPWRALGIDKSTWYRRRKKLAQRTAA